MKKEIELPKLPYGQGTFTWEDQEHTKIRFTKSYTAELDGQTYRLTVRGGSVQECYSLMKKKEKEKEKVLTEDEEETAYSETAALGNAMLDWLKQTKLNKQKATTYDRNERTIKNQILDHRFGKKQVRQITSRDISEHLNYLQFSRSYSYSTVKKTYDILRQYFKYYYLDNMNANPMNRVTPPKRQEEVGEISLDDLGDQTPLEDAVLSDEEIERFREFVFQPPKNGSVGRSKYGVALYFIMVTCLRVGEAVTVTWEDIDLAGKTMLINKTTSRVVDRSKNASHKTKLIITRPKTANGIRTVMLSDHAITALEKIRETSGYTAPKDFVLSADTGKRVTGIYLLRILKGVLKGAKLNTALRDKVFGVHYLRHSGISYYLRHGVPVELVSKMAGHSSIDITTRIYYHIIKDQDQSLLELMNSI